MSFASGLGMHAQSLLSILARILDHPAIIWQASGPHQPYITTQLGDGPNRFHQCCFEGGVVCRHFAYQRHDILAHVTAHDQMGALHGRIAAGSGRVLADMLSGRTPEIDVDGLTMSRFG